jgi:DNA-binding NarL/FixJ family response regulator
MEDSIRVLIADDHPLFRDGMRGLLNHHTLKSPTSGWPRSTA